MKITKIFFLIILCLFTVSFLNALTVDIVNMIPASQSDETNQDSQPDLTVSPDDLLNIVAGVLTPASSGVTDGAPIFISTDGGVTWNLNPIVPSTLGKTKGITVAFGSDKILYAAIINDCLSPDGLMQILRTDDFTNTTQMTPLRERVNIEQPYIRAGFPLIGPLTGHDTIYVGYNDLNAPFFPRTAYIEYSLDAATAPAPAGLNPALVEFQIPLERDGPAVRPAVHPDGTIYAVYINWFNFMGTEANGMASGDLIVVRDDDWGAGAPPAFDDLIDWDMTPGKIVVPDINVRWLEDGLGQERLKDRLAIAVDPNSDISSTGSIGQIVYVAYADTTGSDSTLHVCRSMNSGVNWTLDLKVVPNAINPQLAVNSDGVVAFLYQVLNNQYGTSVPVEPVWETRLEYSFNFGFAWQPPIVLSRTPAAVPVRIDYPYLGDYAGLTAVGELFYGAFSANNTPDFANFPDADNVTYQRNANFGANILLDNTNTNVVDISIDPFFFKVHLTEYYIRNWTVNAVNHDQGEEPSTQWVVWETSDVWNQTSTALPSFVNDIPQNQNPLQGTATNYACARVHRNNADAAETVTLDFLVSEFGCGSPYVPIGSIPLTFAPGDFDKILNPGLPWILGSTTSTYLCLGVQMTAPGDPFTLSLNGLNPGAFTDTLLRLDNNKAQRNMGVFSFFSGGSFYAIVHNWSTNTEDISLAVEPGEMFLEVFQEPRIKIIGGGEYTVSDRQITLFDMEPGENRWIELSLPKNEIPRQMLIPVRFNQLKDNEIVDGFTIAVKRDDLKTCLRETMSFHASVFFRLHHILSNDSALAMSEEARKLADPSQDIERAYAPFCRKYLDEMEQIMNDVLGASQPEDFFGLEAAFNEFIRQIGTGNPNYIQPVHSIFLNKLDACLTMIDKKGGDTADILLNVYWQRALYEELEPLQNYESTQRIIENSSAFITDFSENIVTVKDFPQFISTLMVSFQETANILSPWIDLFEEINVMQEAMESPKALQKAHRDFLLKLAAIDVSESLIGDVNNDGMIDIVDALLVARYYVGIVDPNFVKENADVNCDGEIDIVDALLIARYYVGLISEFC